MQDQIRLAHLLQGGMEGRYQLVGQLVDKAHRIAEQGLAAVGQRHLPHHRVQGGEQLILRQHPRPGQGVEQGALPRVGIPHQGHPRHGFLLPPLPPEAPLFFHRLERFPQLIDPSPDPPLVAFQLGFAGPPGNGARSLPGQILALAEDPG